MPRIRSMPTRNILLALSTNDHVYTNVFPTIQARYEIAPSSSCGAAFPRRRAAGLPADLRGDFLEPEHKQHFPGQPWTASTTAYNIDWSIEKVFDSGSLISLGYSTRN